LAVCALLLSGLRYAHFMRQESDGMATSRVLVGETQRNTNPGDRIVVLDNNDPTMLYLLNRKGWHATVDSLDAAFLQRCKVVGAMYFAGQTLLLRSDVEKAKPASLLAAHEKVYIDDACFLVKL
jgi:hypothetical protein